MRSFYKTHIARSLILRLDIESSTQNFTTCWCYITFEWSWFQQFVVDLKDKLILCSWPILSHSLLCFEVRQLLHFGARNCCTWCSLSPQYWARLLLHFWDNLLWFLSKTTATFWPDYHCWFSRFLAHYVVVTAAFHT